MRRLFIIAWRTSREDLRFLWFVLRHPLRPRWLRPAVFALLLFILSPLNFAIPLIGVIDDMIVVPLILHWLLSRLPLHLHQAFYRGSAAPVPASAARDVRDSN